MARPKQTPVRCKCLAQTLAANHSYSVFHPNHPTKEMHETKAKIGKKDTLCFRPFALVTERSMEIGVGVHGARSRRHSQPGNLLKGNFLGRQTQHKLTNAKECTE